MRGYTRSLVLHTATTGSGLVFFIFGSLTGAALSALYRRCAVLTLSEPLSVLLFFPQSLQHLKLLPCPSHPTFAQGDEKKEREMDFLLLGTFYVGHLQAPSMPPRALLLHRSSQLDRQQVMVCRCWPCYAQRREKERAQSWLLSPLSQAVVTPELATACRGEREREREREREKMTRNLPTYPTRPLLGTK
ncbi:hypothetical protein L7F22_036105 [Adiantum nelumboides]|nr:hypothetical protein [Adiantum nelumboides]